MRCVGHGYGRNANRHILLSEGGAGSDHMFRSATLFPQKAVNVGSSSATLALVAE